FILFSPAFALLAALRVSAAASGTAPPGVQAVPTPVRPTVDGRLDDPVWALAPVLDGFVQLQPEEGRAASERTDVRILYDERAIYVALRCWDSKAAQIHPRLGRRDNAPESDWVAITLDPFHDRRSAYSFSVNSAAVQTDGILTEGASDNYN